MKKTPRPDYTAQQEHAARETYKGEFLYREWGKRAFEASYYKYTPETIATMEKAMWQFNDYAKTF